MPNVLERDGPNQTICLRIKTMKFNQYVSFLIESERKFPRLMVFEIKVKLIDVGLNKADVDQFTKRIMTADAT